MDFDGPWHGNEGRIPVRRIFPDLWPEHAKAAAEAFKQAGYQFRIDQNAEFEDGYFPITISNAYERRVSAAIGYLDPGTRMRENLTISTDTQVSRAAVRGPSLRRREGAGGRAGGRNSAATRSSCAPAPSTRRRICCAPASVRPATCAISASRCARTFPASASGCRTIPAVAVAAFIKPHARIIHDYTRRHIYLALRYSSKLDGIPPGDMFTVVTNKTSWHAVGEQIGSFIVTVYKTYSETGEVKLAARDWRDEPVVEFNLLSDRRDLERMMDGVRRFGAMHLTPTMQAVTADPFPASYSDKVRQVGLINRKNKLITDALAKLLDGPAALRRYLIRKLIMEGFTLEGLLNDDEQLEAFCRKAAVGRLARLLHLPDGQSRTTRWR